MMYYIAYKSLLCIITYIIYSINYWILYWIFGGFYQKFIYFVKTYRNPYWIFDWILYWIIGGFLLNIKSTSFYVKFTRFPYLGYLP